MVFQFSPLYIIIHVLINNFFNNYALQGLTFQLIGTMENVYPSLIVKWRQMVRTLESDRDDFFNFEELKIAITLIKPGKTE